MKIKITGISGYLGQLILSELIRNGHSVTGIKRKILYGATKDLKTEIAGSNIIINLAGAPILQRWTNKNKQTIYDSRIKTTQNLVRAINELPVELQPQKFISASAVGIYKSGISHDESSTTFESNFAGKVVRDWENASTDLYSSVQKIIFRIGLVLGREAQTITNLWLPFKLGLGATIGKGKQPFPFIHEIDVARAFCWAVEEYNQNDIFNLTAPEEITNKTFTKELAQQLHRPAFLFIPGFALKVFFGEAAILLTESPGVSSQKIVHAGFKFRYPDISKALKEITEK